jgi:hypothetical protein
MRTIAANCRPHSRTSAPICPLCASPDSTTPVHTSKIRKAGRKTGLSSVVPAVRIAPGAGLRHSSSTWRVCGFQSPEKKKEPFEIEPPCERAAWSGRQHDCWTWTKVHLHQALPRGSWHRVVEPLRVAPLRHSRTATHAAWATGEPIAASAVQFVCGKGRGGLGRLCGRDLVRSEPTLPRAAPSRTAPRQTG